MAIAGNQHIKALLQQDPSIPEHLDFAFLREKGLEHISKFSGYIWTDHNSHDPGITLLEELCYALLDLGYRTQLPIEDLLARKELKEKEDNFFTPAEILTCNPVTILDYRKLLMELKGVKNAWLEVETGVKLPLQLQECSISRAESNAPEKLIPYTPSLNGLYHVYVELEDWKEAELRQTKDDKSSKEFFRNSIRTFLSSHRNLCEDFHQITCLEKQKIHLCAEVEILPTSNPDWIYEQVLRELRDFISPTARFYSLQALLEKGKAIEEIFAGRPFLPHPEWEQDPSAPRIQSYGFLDTEEVAQIPRRKELHLSDLYTVIHQIEGVRSVKSLKIYPEHPGDLKGCDNTIEDCQEAWRFRLKQGHLPSLSLRDTEIHLYNSAGKLPVDEDKIKNELTSYRKARIEDSRLDLGINPGQFREDLSDYVSTQLDFPRVYGIGEFGLPEEASLLRKTQAKQLQAFLLFFDQLLANYLQQLGNIRHLFSLERESLRNKINQRTYFANQLSAKEVPGIEDLIRLNAGKQSGISEGITLMVPVEISSLRSAICEIEERFNKTLVIDYFNDCLNEPRRNTVVIHQASFPSRNERDALIFQWLRDFELGQYRQEVNLDQTGHYFVLYPESTPDIALLSTLHFTEKREALQIANLGSFLGAWQNNLQELNLQTPSPNYSVSVVYRQGEYGTILNEMVEDPTMYRERREVFLNHLLNRFAENFSDYAALMFSAVEDLEKRKQRSLEDKSHFLSVYDELGRNRGKAFNYQESSWNTYNVSGFERRSALLAGLGDGLRKKLCNIEVIEKRQLFSLTLLDFRKEALLKAEENLPSESLAKTKGEALIAALYSSEWKVNYDPASDSYYIALFASGIRFTSPQEKGFSSEEKAINHSKYILGTYSQSIHPENIEVNRHQFTHELRDSKGNLFVDGSLIFKEKPFEERETAQKAEKRFIQGVNKLSGGKVIPQKVVLHKVASKDYYLNLLGIPYKIVPCPLKWRWKEWTGKGQNYDAHTKTSPSEQEAYWDYFEVKGYPDFLIEQKNTHCWELLGKSKIGLRSIRHFADPAKALTDWKRVKEWGSNRANYTLEEIEKDRYEIVLQDSKGGPIAKTTIVSIGVSPTQDLIQEFVSVFKRKKYKPQTPTQDRSWGFSVDDKEQNPVLVGYGFFATPEEALKSFLKAAEVGKKAKAFQIYGGTPIDPEYIFLLQDDSGALLAQSPDPFGEEEDLKAAIKGITSIFKKTQPIIQVDQEPQTYTFQLEIPTFSKPLIGSEEYLTKRQAESAFRKLLTNFLDDSYPINEKNEKHLLLKNEAGVGIAIPEDGPIKDIRQSISQIFKGESYRVGIRKEPLSWIFIHYWMSAQNQYEPVFQSLNEFSAPSRAKELYTVFLDQRKDYRIADGGREQAIYRLDSNPEASVVVANSDTSRDEIESYFEFFQEDPEKNPNYSVAPINENQEYFYQLLKQDFPHAYHRSWIPDEGIPTLELETSDCPTVIPPKEESKLAPGEPCIDQYFKETYFENYFGNLEEACNKKDELCSKAPETYCWLDLCIPSPGIRRLPTGENDFCKYHYVVKGSIAEKVPETELLLSIQGYDTEELAIQAYHEDIWDIIEFASSFDSYQDTDDEKAKICLNNCFEIEPDACGRTAGYVVAISDKFNPALSDKLRIQLLVVYFNSHPFRYHKDRKQFYFQLYNYEELAAEVRNMAADRDFPMGKPQVHPNWNSWECYTTYEEAQIEFERLMILLEDPTNCRVVCRKGKYRIELYEALMRSCRTYANENEAWGRTRSLQGIGDDCVHQPSPRDNCEEDSDCCTGYGAELFLKKAQCEANLIPYNTSTPKGQSYGFLAVNDCYYVGTHPCWYESVEEAERQREIFLKLISSANQYSIIVEETNGEFQACINPYREERNPPETNEEKIKTSPCGCGEEDPSPFQCPKWFLLHKKFDTPEEAQSYANSFVRRLIAGGTFKAQIKEQSICGPYTFEWVDPCCMLAKNPVPFKEASMRDETMERAKSCLLTEGMHLVEHILLRPQSSDRSPLHEGRSLLDPCPNASCCELTYEERTGNPDPCIPTEEISLQYFPLADIYSFWGTLVLPAWLKRFEAAETRELFEHLLFKESPSHVALNILWLSPREMCEFEACYRYWLAWMEAGKENPAFFQIMACNNPQTDSRLCSSNEDQRTPNGTSLLINCLKSLRANPFCEGATR